MWLQSWLSQYFKKLFLICVIGLHLEAFSQSSGPGIIEGLQEIITSHKKEYLKLTTKLQSENSGLSTLTQEDLKQAEILPDFLNSIFLHSDNKYLKLLKNDNCVFLALLENNLLKTSKGYFSTIPLIIGKEKRPLVVSVEDYVRESYLQRCLNYKQISKLFTKGNLKKTIESLNMETPKNKKSCESTYQNWMANPYLPYLCRIPEAIRKGKSANLALANQSNPSLRLRSYLRPMISEGNYYDKNIPFFQKNYLRNLCNGIENAEKFCQPYLASDVWTKVINGEKPNSYLYFKCKNLYGGKNITLTQMKNCAVQLKSRTDLCTTKTSLNYPSLFPKPNCDISSKAMNIGRLKTKYHDCPGQIDNLSLVNIHRILSHLGSKTIKSSPANCASETNYSYAKLNLDFQNEQGWPLRICYDDKIEAKEVCKIYIPGNLGDNPLSEEIVASKILQRLNKIGNRVQCKVIGSKQYKPSLLEYKNGCFIIFDEDLCNNAYCPKKIIVDEKEVTGLTYRGENVFDYFPTNHIKRKFSALNMMNEVHKYKNNVLKNLTMLEIYLEKFPNGIVHGIGCAEDILPAHFHAGTLNHCTPLPFIIDGITTDKGNKILSIRTAVDDLHSPRIIPWNFIFSAVGNYRKLHPLNAWNLYGIK